MSSQPSYQYCEKPDHGREEVEDGVGVISGDPLVLPSSFSPSDGTLQIVITLLASRITNYIDKVEQNKDQN